jgi:hypothetical protein
MSAFSERIRSQKHRGLYKVSDLERGEKTHVISHLDEQMEMFGKTVDVLNFIDTGRQLQLNQTNAEFLLDEFGDDPMAWEGKRVTLFLAEYEYRNEKKLGIRLKLPNGPVDTALPAPPKQAAPPPSDMDDEIPF